MSIEADVTVTFRCDGCHRNLEDHRLCLAYCDRCREKDDGRTKRGDYVRQWADRQRLLGRLTPADLETLDRLAYDLDEPRKQSAA